MLVRSAHTSLQISIPIHDPSETTDPIDELDTLMSHPAKTPLSLPILLPHRRRRHHPVHPSSKRPGRYVTRRHEGGMAGGILVEKVHVIKGCYAGLW